MFSLSGSSWIFHFIAHNIIYDYKFSHVYFCLLSVPHPHLTVTSMTTGATFVSFIRGPPAPSAIANTQ